MNENAFNYLEKSVSYENAKDIDNKITKCLKIIVFQTRAAVQTWTGS
jgi:hypothetical protein